MEIEVVSSVAPGTSGGPVSPSYEGKGSLTILEFSISISNWTLYSDVSTSSELPADSFWYVPETGNQRSPII